MRSKKLWSLLALLLAFSLIAAACDGDGEDTTTTGAELSGEVELMWIRGEDHPEGQALLAVLDAFTEQTGVEVVYSGVGDDLPTILSTRIEGGDPPDVAMVAQPGLVTDLAARGALVPASQAVIDAVDANYGAVWKELGTRDGTLYGVWPKASNKSLIWYFVPTFDELGIDPPETWDDLLAISQTLVDNGIAPMSVAGADGWTLSDWFEDVYVRVAGQEGYEQLTAHEIPWTDPTVKQAFETMGELIGNPDYVAEGLDGALQLGYVAAQVNAFGDTQGAAMMKGASDLGAAAAAEAGTNPEDLNFFPFPSIEGSPGAVLGSGDIALAFTDSPNAQALLEFLASPEAADVWIPLGGFTSPNRNADLNLYPDELLRAAATALVEADIFVFDMSDSVPSALGATTGAGIWGGLQTWMESPGNVDAVLEQLEAEAEAAQPMG